MRRTPSLRLRLFTLILVPLVLMAIILGFWRIYVAQNTANELFDRTLLSAALAVSRDVAVSGGDALSPTTRDLIEDASGGEVFYHVTGPGGIYVTGYAYPPIPSTGEIEDRYSPAFFHANYRDEPVRVLRVTERVTIENLTGDTTVTVWQRMAEREAFANQLALFAVILMGALLITLSLVVWFGVAHGLRPLVDLQEAISIRTPDDLSRIRRPVPVEVSGIVQTLNRLLGQVENSLQAHQVFISDAAHQLRNPASALLAMAETLPGVTDPVQRREREKELIQAAQNSARLAEQLLSLERLRADGMKATTKFDLNDVARSACARLGPVILSSDKRFEFEPWHSELPVRGDALLLGEAISNLIDNALQHGGPTLTSISVKLDREGDKACVTVADDGKGLPPDKSDIAFRRFGQLEVGQGSGLGLSIAKEIVDSHGGDISVMPAATGAAVHVRIPVNVA